MTCVTQHQPDCALELIRYRSASTTCPARSGTSVETSDWSTKFAMAASAAFGTWKTSWLTTALKRSSGRWSARSGAGITPKRTFSTKPTMGLAPLSVIARSPGNDSTCCREPIDQTHCRPMSQFVFIRKDGSSAQMPFRLGKDSLETAACYEAQQCENLRAL